MSDSSVCSIDGTLSGATTLGQSGPGRDNNERVLLISQSFWIGSSPSGCLVSYPEYSLGGGRLTCLLRSSWCILQPQPAGLSSK